MSKILALDVGERRIGVAIGDLELKMAFPREAIDAQLEDSFEYLNNLISLESISLLIVGLPLNSDGTENQQCEYTRNFVENLLKKTDIAVEYFNEYATTKEAQQRFRHFGARQTARKIIDSTAALIILEAYFNKLNG